MVLTVTVIGMEKLLAKLKPTLYQDAVKTLLTQAALIAEREARLGTPKDTGALARSISHDVQPLMARVYSGLSYAVPVEFGRGAGKRMPPPQALVGWIRRHNLNVSPFVLARAIARRGIRGRFFFRKAAEATKKALPGLLGKAAVSIQAKWGSN